MWQVWSSIHPGGRSLINKTLGIVLSKNITRPELQLHLRGQSDWVNNQPKNPTEYVVLDQGQNVAARWGTNRSRRVAIMSLKELTDNKKKTYQQLCLTLSAVLTIFGTVKKCSNIARAFNGTGRATSSNEKYAVMSSPFCAPALGGRGGGRWVRSGSVTEHIDLINKRCDALAPEGIHQIFRAGLRKTALSLLM